MVKKIMPTSRFSGGHSMGNYLVKPTSEIRKMQKKQRFFSEI